MDVDPQTRRDIRSFVAGVGPPALLAGVMITLSLADLFFLGRLVGVHAVAAVGPSLLILWALAPLAAGPALMFHQLNATDAPSWDATSTGALLNSALLAALAISVPLAVGAWFVAPQAFALLSDPTSVTHVALPYLRWRIIALPAFALFMIYGLFFDAIGDRLPIALFCGILIAANLGLNGLFLILSQPSPAVASQAVGLSSTIALAASLAGCIAWTIRPSIRRSTGVYRLRQISLRHGWKIASTATAITALAAVAVLGVFATFHVIDLADQQARDAAIAAAHGESFLISVADWHSIDAHWPARVLVDDWAQSLAYSRPSIYMASASVIVAIIALVVAPALSGAHFISQQFRQALGESDLQRADRLGWIALTTSVAAIALVSIPAILFPGPLLRQFTTDVDLIASAVPVLRLMASLGPLIAITIVLIAVHFGLGHRRVAITTVALQALCISPLAYVLALALQLGFMGIWWSMTLVIAAGAVALAVHYWFGAWRFDGV